MFINSIKKVNVISVIKDTHKNCIKKSNKQAALCVLLFTLVPDRYAAILVTTIVILQKKV